MAAEKGYDDVSASLEYPRGGCSEMDRDPEGQLRGYDMTSLQTAPCQIAGMLALSSCTNSLINLQDMWTKDFIYVALACT